MTPINFHDTNFELMTEPKSFHDPEMHFMTPKNFHDAERHFMTQKKAFHDAENDFMTPRRSIFRMVIYLSPLYPPAPIPDTITITVTLDVLLVWFVLFM